MSVNNPTCPTGCSSYLQEVDFDYCNPDVQFGEIDHIYVMADDGSNLLDWTDLSVWNARLALDPTSDADAIIELDVIGDTAPPEKEEIEISLARKIQSPGTFTVNYEIDDVSDDNYEFMRWLECNTRFKIWYSANEVIFGGNTGIQADMTGGYQIERGQKALQKIVGMIKWEAKFSPERTTNPMA